MSLQFSDDPLKAERLHSRVRDELPGWSCEKPCTAIWQRVPLLLLPHRDRLRGVHGRGGGGGGASSGDVRYDRVRLRLTTHDAGGVTEKDLELARRLDGRGQ
jgi:hypothetical protein